MDTNQPIQVPVTFNKRNCMAELGCEELFGDEDVFVRDYGPYPFKVNLYARN
jgi:hypothetical protein